MFSGLDHSFTFATLIALLPCLLSWWSGTQLAQRVDDPVLPERFMAHQRRNGMLLAAAIRRLGDSRTAGIAVDRAAAVQHRCRRRISAAARDLRGNVELHRVPVLLPPADDRRLRRVDRARRHAGARGDGRPVRLDRRCNRRGTGGRVGSPLLESPPLPAALPAARRRPAARALPPARHEVSACPAAVPPRRPPRRCRRQRAGAARHLAPETPCSSRTRSWSGWTRTRSSQSADTSSRTSSPTTGRGCSASAGRPPRLPSPARR